MRLSHFSLCLLTAAICTQLYAEDTATNDSTTQNTEAKLPTIAKFLIIYHNRSYGILNRF